MGSRQHVINAFSSQPTNVVLTQDIPVVESAFAAPSPATGHPYDILMRFDEVLAKLLEMCKKLRDMMNAYNAQRQVQAWTLDVNALTKTRDGIQKAYTAAIISAVGGMGNGACGLVGTFTGARAVKTLKSGMSDFNYSDCNQAFARHQGMGHDFGQSFNSGFAVGASYMTKEADTAKAEAELLNKSAHAYSKTQEDLETQVKNIMREIQEMMQKYVEHYSQALQHLAR
ncbi:translocation machinery component [Sodalis glossinidius str. 'morsitans']|uniref:Translocation machinery component n=1 Tax=Sodalis glossinidius (strain morsitans) TaxID=343509 RepID=Q2NTG1_SODGM|nr:translocation machinery component [Sodalis glossinidius]BAE74564.1 translocation machinery component [Sodalis glossinidius str. 'morsitans']